MNAFLKGFASILDLFGTMAAPIDLPRTDEEAFLKDAAALREDLRAIASDSYVMSAAEARTLSDHNNRPRPTVASRRLPTRRRT